MLEIYIYLTKHCRPIRICYVTLNLHKLYIKCLNTAPLSLFPVRRFISKDIRHDIAASRENKSNLWSFRCQFRRWICKLTSTITESVRQLFLLLPFNSVKHLHILMYFKKLVILAESGPSLVFVHTICQVNFQQMQKIIIY